MKDNGKRDITVGVLGLQGDIEEHVSMVREAISRSGIQGDVILVKSIEDVKAIDALVIPGGESTVMGALSSIKGIMPALREAIRNGLPTLGTCAGMIMLAKKADDRVMGEMKQTLIGALDITVERNSFGRQRESFESDLELGLTPGKKPMDFHAVFIRAPSVKSIGTDVREMARLGEKLVAVQQGNIVATGFHPELGSDTTIHEYLLGLASQRAQAKP